MLEAAAAPEASRAVIVAFVGRRAGSLALLVVLPDQRLGFVMLQLHEGHGVQEVAGFGQDVVGYGRGARGEGRKAKSNDSEGQKGRIGTDKEDRR